MNKFYPIYFRPVYKSYIWGGTRIASRFSRRDIPEKVAESWEVSDRDDGMSVVANGKWEGLSLHELMLKLKSDLVGKNRKDAVFPLLIKIIDANDNLSVQVHPDDEVAKRLKADAKEEAWYFLETSEKAAVYAGFAPHVEKAAFESVANSKAILEMLQKIYVKKGDVISIPGGRVHAILSGCLLMEVQQNSNTTYRIYDWDRKDNKGMPRPLHLEQAFQSIRWDDPSQAKVLPRPIYRDEALEIELLLKTPYFEMQKWSVKKSWHYQYDGSSFQVFFALDGSAELVADGEKEKMLLGRTYLIPAATKEVKIEPLSHSVEVLRITL